MSLDSGRSPAVRWAFALAALAVFPAFVQGGAIDDDFEAKHRKKQGARIADDEKFRNRIDSLRKASRPEAIAVLATDADRLREPLRTEMLRSLVDALCEDYACALATRPLQRLLPEMSDRATFLLITALEAATARDADGLVLRTFDVLGETESTSARAEALILLSRRAALSIETREGAERRPLPWVPAGAGRPEGEMVPPRIVHGPGALYPDSARRDRLTGQVVLRTVVLSTGETLVVARMSSTDPVFVVPAAEAVARWRHEPGTVGGKKVEFCWTIRVDFRLN